MTKRIQPPSGARSQPLCFVLLPFGSQPDAAGRVIDFDAVYDSMVEPALEQAGMRAIRADPDELGVATSKPPYEDMLLSDYAVIDLSRGSPAVHYALGLRHALQPRTTVCLAAEGTQQDLTARACVSYSLVGGVPAHADIDAEKITAALTPGNERAALVALFRLVSAPFTTQVSHLKTDIFRNEVAYPGGPKLRLATARIQGKHEIDRVRSELGSLADVPAAVAIDLLLSYRAVGAWDDMIELTDEMSDPLRRSVLVREQLGFALSRANRSEEAEGVLRELLTEWGASSETCGILGQVYKDRWEQSVAAGHKHEAQSNLLRAIHAYRTGFEADWRDAYPGVNAVTLMEVAEPPDPSRYDLLLVVSYAAQRRVASGTTNYWDHASLLELEVLRKDPHAAKTQCEAALDVAEEPWQLETTIRNLGFIREARRGRNEDTAWLDAILAQLERQRLQLKASVS